MPILACLASEIQILSKLKVSPIVDRKYFFSSWFCFVNFVDFHSLLNGQRFFLIGLLHQN